MDINIKYKSYNSCRRKLYCTPINTSEERMCLDLLNSSQPGSYSGENISTFTDRIIPELKISLKAMCRVTRATLGVWSQGS